MALLARARGNTFHFSHKCLDKFSSNFVNFILYKKFSFPCYSTCLKNTSNLRRFSSANSSNIVKAKEKITFDEIISQRRDQARRSIVVQVNAVDSSYELYNYCSRFGNVKEMHHYSLGNGLNFVLIEFNHVSDKQSIDYVSTHINMQQIPPVVSPWFWFKVASDETKKSFLRKKIPLTVTNGKHLTPTEKLNNIMYKADSVRETFLKSLTDARIDYISDQMTILWNSMKLNDTDIRLRFICARQIESSLQGIFANISVLPFGSSVNGFGKNGCDLDLVLKLQSNVRENPQSRLIYHTKSTLLNNRIQAQKIMEIISDVMCQFLPGVSNIRKILRARVPIIEFHQTLTGLECDLSMTNTIGIHTSELLYMYGELDSRVRPFIFTIRMWAHHIQLTNKSPGAWITNFSLTLLGLFYLQQKAILPSLQELVQLASKNDVRIADDCVDCTFLRDISKLPKPFSTNRETLEELLRNFFIYYAAFDFLTKAVSLNEGKPLNKPKESNLYIFNPFEKGLNVTKNMNVKETERLKIEMRNAAWLLDSGLETKSKSWGLLSLFHQKDEKFTTKSDRGSNSENHMERSIELSEMFKNNKSTGGKAVENHKNSSPVAQKQSFSISSGLVPDRRQHSYAKRRFFRPHQGQR